MQVYGPVKMEEFIPPYTALRATSARRPLRWPTNRLALTQVTTALGSISRLIVACFGNVRTVCCWT